MIGPIRICWNYFFYHPATLENGIGRLGKFLLTTSCRPGCLGSGKARRNQTCELGALAPASVSTVICCADKERNHAKALSQLSVAVCASCSDRSRREGTGVQKSQAQICARVRRPLRY